MKARTVPLSRHTALGLPFVRSEAGAGPGWAGKPGHVGDPRPAQHAERPPEAPASAPDRHPVSPVSAPHGGSAPPRCVRPAQRIWLQEGGTPLFGPDAYALLLRVAEVGSLRQAASQVGVSYSKAWHIVNEAEARLGVQLFERRVGGSTGGGTALTTEGWKLGERFGALIVAADRDLGDLYERYFGDLPFAGAAVETAGGPQRLCRRERRC